MAGQGLDLTRAEMLAMAEGKDLQQWRHTILLYSSGFQQNKATFRLCFPYEQKPEVSPEEGKAAMQAMKGAFQNGKRHIDI